VAVREESDANNTEVELHWGAVEEASAVEVEVE